MERQRLGRPLCFQVPQLLRELKARDLRLGDREHQAQRP